MGEHIPRFRDKDAEATFWERTGLDQLSPDEYEAVQVERPDRPLSATFAIRLDPQTVELLRHVAGSQGLGATQLVRSWILERLRIERAVGVLAETNEELPPDFELALRRMILDTLMTKIPEAVEEAMQEVLARADLESDELRESLQ